MPAKGASTKRSRNAELPQPSQADSTDFAQEDFMQRMLGISAKKVKQRRNNLQKSIDQATTKVVADIQEEVTIYEQALIEKYEAFKAEEEHFDEAIAAEWADVVANLTAVQDSIRNSAEVMEGGHASTGQKIENALHNLNLLNGEEVKFFEACRSAQGGSNEHGE